MSRAILVFTVFLGLAAFSQEAKAQDYGDPFFLYYGYFLPRQQAIAATPTVTDTLNAASAARQGNAVSNRANLYDPNGNYAPLDDTDSPNGGGGQRVDPRGGRIAAGSFPSGNISGTGPALHYNRTARYYPGMRAGQGPNRNLSVAPARGRVGGMGGGGGYGMSSATAGMRPGPR